MNSHRGSCIRKVTTPPPPRLGQAERGPEPQRPRHSRRPLATAGECVGERAALAQLEEDAWRLRVRREGDDADDVRVAKAGEDLRSE